MPAIRHNQPADFDSNNRALARAKRVAQSNDELIAKDQDDLDMVEDPNSTELVPVDNSVKEVAEKVYGWGKSSVEAATSATGTTWNGLVGTVKDFLYSKDPDKVSWKTKGAGLAAVLFAIPTFQSIKESFALSFGKAQRKTSAPVYIVRTLGMIGTWLGIASAAIPGLSSMFTRINEKGQSEHDSQKAIGLALFTFLFDQLFVGLNERSNLLYKFYSFFGLGDSAADVGGVLNDTIHAVTGANEKQQPQQA